MKNLKNLIIHMEFNKINSITTIGLSNLENFTLSLSSNNINNID